MLTGKLCGAIRGTPRSLPPPKTKKTYAQVWDPLTGKLRRDLGYQAEERFMMHDTAVLALAFSRDSELLATGCQDGRVKVCARGGWMYVVCLWTGGWNGG